ncbi:FtsQ-type POTRA domain-containing protein [Candidatus Pelagibacter sp.]|nr:FtsQ-type POTRA domain-containing protein [Candidatus Pelagibacter sp.]
MLQLTDKKNRIIIYLLFLFILSTINNKNTNFSKSYSTKINKINVTGLSNDNNLEVVKKLNNLLYENIFFINREEINNIISKDNIIEEYNIQKIYPSELKINIKQTKFIAKIYDNKDLFVGSNGKLIKSKTNKEVLPEIKGEFNSEEFLKFKKIIDSSRFIFLEFKLIFFYPLNRWDVLTNDDILIRLPHNKLKKSLALAHKIIKDNQFINKKIIDLRVSNQLIIK